MAQDQAKDKELSKLIVEAKSDAQKQYRIPPDGVLEKRIEIGKTDKEVWSPVVPAGWATAHLTWRRWVFLQVHVGPFGGHRLLDQTMLEPYRDLARRTPAGSDVGGTVHDLLKVS